MSTHEKEPHGIKAKTDGLDFIDGLEVNGIEKLERKNDLNVNVFEPKEEKSLAQPYLSNYLNTDNKEEIHENNFEKFREDNYRDNFVGSQQEFKEYIREEN